MERHGQFEFLPTHQHGQHGTSGRYCLDVSTVVMREYAIHRYGGVPSGATAVFALMTTETVRACAPSHVCIVIVLGSLGRVLYLFRVLPVTRRTFLLHVRCRYRVIFPMAMFCLLSIGAFTLDPNEYVGDRFNVVCPAPQ